MPPDQRITLHARLPQATPPSTSAASDDRRHVEAALSEILGGPAAVLLTSSCTHALEASARLLGLGPDDEVVVPAFSFPSTANAFLGVGARLRFADVDIDTGNLDPRSLERRLNEQTAAVVAVHYGGVPVDVDAIVPMCAEHAVDLVEDAAHGLFGWSGTAPLGRIGRVASFSFHHTKNISAIEGGALVLNDSGLIDAAAVLLDKGTNREQFDSGSVDAYEWCGYGSAWRMPAPLIGALELQLAQADQIQTSRMRSWTRYQVELRSWADATGVALPTVPPNVRHPAHLFWLRLPAGTSREHLVAHCDRAGIEVARHYGSLPDSRFGRTIADERDACPGAAALAERLVRLPLHHELDDSDVDRVIDVLKAWQPSNS